MREAGGAGAEVDRVEAELGELGHRRPRLLGREVEVADRTQALDERIVDGDGRSR